MRLRHGAEVKFFVSRQCPTKFTGKVVSNWGISDSTKLHNIEITHIGSKRLLKKERFEVMTRTNGISSFKLEDLIK